MVSRFAHTWRSKPDHFSPSSSWLQWAAISGNRQALACFARSRPSDDKAKPELVPVLWLARVCFTHCVWPLKHCSCVTGRGLCWAAGRFVPLTGQQALSLLFKDQRLRLKADVWDVCLSIFTCGTQWKSDSGHEGLRKQDKSRPNTLLNKV